MHPIVSQVGASKRKPRSLQLGSKSSLPTSRGQGEVLFCLYKEDLSVSVDLRYNSVADNVLCCLKIEDEIMANSDLFRFCLRCCVEQRVWLAMEEWGPHLRVCRVGQAQTRWGGSSVKLQPSHGLEAWGNNDSITSLVMVVKSRSFWLRRALVSGKSVGSLSCPSKQARASHHYHTPG